MVGRRKFFWGSKKLLQKLIGVQKQVMKQNFRSGFLHSFGNYTKNRPPCG